MWACETHGVASIPSCFLSDPEQLPDTLAAADGPGAAPQAALLSPGQVHHGSWLGLPVPPYLKLGGGGPAVLPGLIVHATVTSLRVASSCCDVTHDALATGRRTLMVKKYFQLLHRKTSLCE